MNKATKQLLDLIAKHPDIEVVPLVDNELTTGEYGYTTAEWGSSHLGEYCVATIAGEEKYYDDRLSFMEDWIDDNLELLEEKYGADEEKYEEEAEVVADKLFVPAIIVYVV